MGIRSPFDADSSSSHIVDKMIGNAYPVVRAVYAKLDQISYLVENTDDILAAGAAALGALEGYTGPETANLIGYTASGIGAVTRSVAAKLQESVSISDHSAVGDGVTDITATFQAVIDARSLAGGGIVRVPFTGIGIYRQDGTVTLKDNVEIVIDVGVTIDCSVATVSNSYTATGTVGAEVEIANALSIGSTVVTTKSAHGLAVGDYILLKSQRACLHDDAGDAWRLGETTAGTLSPFFAEPLQVVSVETALSFTVGSGVIFPDYRPDATQETYASARASSTIQKINFVNGISIKGGKFIKRNASGSLFRLTLCKEPVLDIGECSLGYSTGSAILEYSCLRGSFTAKATRPADWTLDGLDHSGFNSYKDVGGWYNTWVVEDTQGCQGWDQTFVSSGQVTLYPTVRMRSFDSHEDGLTTHGACYGAKLYCEAIRPAISGVRNRARFAEIYARVIGSGNVNGAGEGVLLSGWGALDVKVIEPFIQGTVLGIEINQKGVTATAQPEHNLSIVDATIINTTAQAILIRDRVDVNVVPSKISISNLTIKDCIRGLYVGAFVHGVQVDGVEVCHLDPSAVRYGVEFRPNSAGNTVRNVRGYDIGAANTLLRLGGLVDASVIAAYARCAEVDWGTIRLFGTGIMSSSLAALKSLNTLAYTLSPNDIGSTVHLRSASSITCTIPDGAVSDIPIGGVTTVMQPLAGRITFVPAAGVTLTSAKGLISSGEGAEVRLRRINSTTWLVSGDLVAS